MRMLQLKSLYRSSKLSGGTCQVNLNGHDTDDNLAGLFRAEIFCVSNWTSRHLSHAPSRFPNRGQQDGVKEVSKFPCAGLPKSSRPTAGGCESIPFPCGYHPSCALQKAMLQTDPLGALTFKRTQR